MKAKYADSTLQRMTKQELIEYIRCLEHNLQNAEETNQRQYEILLSMRRRKKIPYEELIKRSDNNAV